MSTKPPVRPVMMEIWSMAMGAIPIASRPVVATASYQVPRNATQEGFRRRTVKSTALDHDVVTALSILVRVSNAMGVVFKLRTVK